VKKIIFLFLFLLSIIDANSINFNTQSIDGCILEQEEDIDIYFEGYKTNFKVGVTGRFKNIKYKKNLDNAKNLLELLKNYSAIIDKKSLYTTQNKVSENLLKYFFNILEGDKIEVKILDLKARNHDEVIAAAKLENNKKDKKVFDYKKGSIVLEVKMNNVVKNIDMSYYIKKNILHSTGKLDLLDFNASDALSSLNEACFDQHLGKTWADVSINFMMSIKKVCKKGVEL